MLFSQLFAECFLHYRGARGVAGNGYMMKDYTQLPPVAMCLVLTVAVFVLPPCLYEVLRRIPVARWRVLGITKRKERKL